MLLERVARSSRRIPRRDAQKYIFNGAADQECAQVLYQIYDGEMDDLSP